MDGTITKAPLGGQGTGPNPTGRAKSGTKRSLLVEGKGIPIAVTVDGANTHDMKLTEETLESIVIDRPKPTKEHPQIMYLDKGYDFPEVDELVEDWGYTEHIARRGVDQSKRKNTGLSSEAVGRREDKLMDEQIQAPADQVGEEEGELSGNATPCVRMDNLPSSWNIRISSKFAEDEGFDSLWVMDLMPVWPGYVMTS